MSDVTSDKPLPTARLTDRERQGVIGLTLATTIIGGWLVLFVWANFFYPWGLLGWWGVVPTIAAITWLYVGMFIVAHDTMHGTVVPTWPAINPWIGRIALFFYSAFSYDRMRTAHLLHHRHPASGDDPDFHDEAPHAFWPWYWKFLVEYFGWREISIIAGVLALCLVLGAPKLDLMLFWAVPSMLSSIQLFVFGTYLPHRPGNFEITDRHHARSNDYPWVVSLLTCLHFGYHHEHHSNPMVPWWRLPRLRHDRRHGG